MTALVIERCGPATSLQDLGRPGFARLGLAPAGAMDRRALVVANALVRNAAGDAAIEMAYLGLEARVVGGSCRLALAGAPARIRIDGRPVPDHTSFVLHEGQTLVVGRVEAGLYMMLAVAGGFAVAPVLGSRSVDRRAVIGGFNGRPLQAGDRLELIHLDTHDSAEFEVDRIALEPDRAIRVVPGPQHDTFAGGGLATLFAAPFTVSHAIDRMAYRLVGPVIQRVVTADMISEPTMPGSIQVPPDGLPLVMMADRQTIGGYPKIATVISSDLATLAQRPPGSTVRFEAVDVVTAQAIAARASRVASDVGLRVIERCSGFRLDHVGDAAVNAVAADTWEHGPRGRSLSA